MSEKLSVVRGSAKILLLSYPTKLVGGIYRNMLRNVNRPKTSINEKIRPLWKLAPTPAPTSVDAYLLPPFFHSGLITQHPGLAGELFEKL